MEIRFVLKEDLDNFSKIVSMKLLLGSVNINLDLYHVMNTMYYTGLMPNYKHLFGILVFIHILVFSILCILFLTYTY
jgi:hypothetical protein